MPRITVSEELHRQIQSASDKDMENTLWEMVGSYRRMNTPESDTN